MAANRPKRQDSEVDYARLNIEGKSSGVLVKNKMDNDALLDGKESPFSVHADIDSEFQSEATGVQEDQSTLAGDTEVLSDQNSDRTEGSNGLEDNDLGRDDAWEQQQKAIQVNRNRRELLSKKL